MKISVSMRKEDQGGGWLSEGGWWGYEVNGGSRGGEIFSRASSFAVIS